MARTSIGDIELAERIQEVLRLAGGSREECEGVCRCILPWHPSASNILLAAMVIEIRNGACDPKEGV